MTFTTKLGMPYTMQSGACPLLEYLNDYSCGEDIEPWTQECTWGSAGNPDCIYCTIKTPAEGSEEFPSECAGRTSSGSTTPRTDLPAWVGAKDPAMSSTNFPQMF